MKTWNKTDSIVLSICLLILGIAFYFLYLESRPGDRRQGKVVGEISFKYRVAQRKLSNSMIWNDVEQNFPAYNYDSIRTDKKSEAIIRIKDKTTKIELDPNSMFLIIVEDDRVIFDLKQGSFYIKNTGKNRVEKLSVRTGDYLGNLQEGEFRIHHNEERTIFHALQGILEFFIDGQKGTVQKGETYEIRNKQISKLEHSIELKIPFDNARFFYDNNSQEVSFSWNAGNADQECVFILSEDRDFSKIIHKEISKNTSFRVSLTEGIYYWKVIYKDGGQGSMVHKLRLIQKPVVELLSPKNKEKFFFFEDKASVYFHWLPSKLYTYHILEISKNINFDIIEKKVKLERDSIRIFLSEGEYFWRLNSYGNFKEIETKSGIQNFQVIQQKPYKPILLSPAQNAFIQQEKIKKGLQFIWKTPGNTGHYNFYLSSDASFNSLIFKEENIKTNYIKYQGKLEEGVYYWKVKLQTQEAPEASTQFSVFTEKEKWQEEKNESRKISYKKRLKNLSLKANKEVFPTSNTNTQFPVREPFPAASKEVEVVKKEIRKNQKPLIIYPKHKSTVDMNNMETLPLRWTMDKEVKLYKVKLYQLKGGKKVIFQKEIKSNTVNITDLSILDVGEFLFELSAVFENEEQSSESIFKISLNEQPEAPSGVNSGKKSQ